MRYSLISDVYSALAGSLHVGHVSLCFVADGLGAMQVKPII